MPTGSTFLAFAVVAVILASTPGPNMIYLLSRTVSQGVNAGFLSLIGVAMAFILYCIATALGVSAILMAAPLAYEALRWGGAAYLLYLAWEALRPGGRSPLELRPLSAHSRGRLIAMGFVTNLLNPKAAVLYMSLLPQFIDPTRGGAFRQGLLLGGMQIVISFTINALVILLAGRIALQLQDRPGWRRAQRWLMGSVLGGLAVRMAIEGRR